MSESSLSALLLNLAIQFATPGASPYSLKPVADCGTDPLRPLCALKPVCAEPRLSCRAPYWSRTWEAWVRVESPAEAKARYSKVTRSLAHTAEKLLSCDDASCDPIPWPSGSRQLALAALTVVLHESGLREDVQFGRKPLGRGPAGEACLMQLDARDAPYLASWVPEEEREAIAYSKEKRETFAVSLLGDSSEALGRCFEVGMRMLARARNSCSHRDDWAHGMFSMYGTGTTCNAGVLRNRTATYKALVSRSYDYLRNASKKSTKPAS